MADCFREYAQCYDLVYADKDYRGEAEFAASLLGRTLGRPPKQIRVLDLACGTGRHAQELARLGFEVEGADVSEDMISVAREHAAELHLPIRFHNESFQTCDRIQGRYEGVIAMFSAINYLTDHRDLARCLSNIRGLLREGGVFLFDFWNGNAVLKTFSPTRVRHVEKGEMAVVRTSTTTLDALSQIAEVRFDFVLTKATRIVQTFSEFHRIRYFFPQEMVDLLAANGFEVAHRCPFLRADAALDPDEWNLTYVTRPCA